MISWLKSKLGIDAINKNIVENNIETKNRLIEISNSIENLIPDKENKITETAEKFVLQNHNSELTFQLTNDITIDKDWSLVKSQNKTTNFLSQIANTSSVGSSVAYSANELYIATANTNSLMTYSNGSLSSITMNGNQFSNHAGFVSANTSVFTPILAIQFASMLTGQYYFNGLTKQLSSIQNSLIEIQKLHHNERLAKLEFISNKIIELNNRNYFAFEDYVIIDKLKYDLSIIRFEYLLSAQQEITNLIENKEIKECEDNVIETIAEDSNRIEKTLISIKRNTKKISSFLTSVSKKAGINSVIDSSKTLLENSNNEVEKILKKLNESNFFFFSDVALKSEELYQLIKLLELKINLSDKEPNINRVGKIQELYSSIIGFKYDDSIYEELRMLKNNLKDELLLKIEIYRNNSKIGKTKIDAKTEEFISKFDLLEKNIEKNSVILNDIEKIKTAFETPHQILIDNRTETTRIYTKPLINN